MVQDCDIVNIYLQDMCEIILVWKKSKITDTSDILDNMDTCQSDKDINTTEARLSDHHKHAVRNLFSL